MLPPFKVKLLTTWYMTPYPVVIYFLFFIFYFLFFMLGAARFTWSYRELSGLMFRLSS